MKCGDYVRFGGGVACILGRMREAFGPPNLDELRAHDFICLSCKNLFHGKWFTKCPHCDSDNIDSMMRGKVLVTCTDPECGHVGTAWALEPDDEPPRCGSWKHMNDPRDARPLATVLNPYNLLEVLAHAAAEDDHAADDAGA